MSDFRDCNVIKMGREFSVQRATNEEIFAAFELPEGINYIDFIKSKQKDNNNGNS